MSARTQLRTASAHAGYRPAELDVLADITLGQPVGVEALSETQAAAVITAVTVAHAAGMTPAGIHRYTQLTKTSHGEQWRTEVCKQLLAAANRRAQTAPAERPPAKPRVATTRNDAPVLTSAVSITA